MNKVANIEGKGRDDLNLSILLAAEGVIRKVSVNCSKSIRSLAENVKNTFVKFRKMLNKYSENIESVDPQLKNNSDLVDNLYSLEVAWEKGKEFLLNNQNYERLIFFSQLIEILCEKYQELTELIETRDPSIFVSVPGLLILKCLEGEDQGICEEYNPNMFMDKKDCNKLFKELQSDYSAIKDKLDIKHMEMDIRSNCTSRISSSSKIFRMEKNKEIKEKILNSNSNNEELKSGINLTSTIDKKEKVRFDIFFLYNFLENIILFEENLDEVLKSNPGYTEFYNRISITKFLGKIKTLSMNLQREKPTEWNAFFDMAMNTISS